jgi:hypothetical protein
VSEGPELTGLTLLDLSDREFLLIVRDAGGAPPGWVSAADVAAHLNLTGDNPGRSVSSRLSWLKRWGAVERQHERDEAGNIRYHRNGKVVYAQGWQLTEVGFAMAVGKLNTGTEKSLDKLTDGQMLVMTRWLSQRVKSSDLTVSKLMDREYRYGVGRR